MKIKIKKSVLARWADIILNDCFKGINTADIVMIKGEAVAWPLISVLQEKILKVGAMADVSLSAPDNEYGRVYGATVAKFADIRSLRLPLWQVHRYQNLTKYIEILGMETPELMRGTNNATMRKIIQLHGKIQTIRRKIPAVFTMFPTPAFAKSEGMPFKTYSGIVSSASVKSRKALKKLARHLTHKLESTRVIRIITREPGMARDYLLELNIYKNNILEDFDCNIPSGEVYTSPNACGVSGEVYCDVPCRIYGTTILQGVYLKFNGGRVVGYHAKKGQRVLGQILGTDAGARRLGEVAFGLNNMLKKVLLHPIFSEKLSGTMHIALGNGFAKAHVAAPGARSGKTEYKKLIKAGVANVSAQHVDLVISFRRCGAGKAVYLDDKQMQINNGNWSLRP